MCCGAYVSASRSTCPCRETGQGTVRERPRCPLTRVVPCLWGLLPLPVGGMCTGPGLEGGGHYARVVGNVNALCCLRPAHGGRPCERLCAFGAAAGGTGAAPVAGLRLPAHSVDSDSRSNRSTSSSSGGTASPATWSHTSLVCMRRSLTSPPDSH